VDVLTIRLIYTTTGEGSCPCKFAAGKSEFVEG